MIRKSIIAVSAVLFTAGVANAAVTNFTEGTGSNRPLIIGSIDLEDAAPGGAGFDLGTLGAGDTFGIYGRIVSSVDRFSFDFSSASAFDVSFDFDGYETVDGTVAQGWSGLIDQSVVNAGTDPSTTGGGKGVRISLFQGLTEVVSQSYTTNVVFGAVSSIFSNIAAGEYTLVVDGSVGPNKSRPALYDLQVTAVPIPAALPLLAGGIGLLGVAGWRRRKSATA